MAHAHHLVLALTCPDRPGIVHTVRWHAEHRVFVNGGRTVVFR